MSEISFIFLLSVCAQLYLTLWDLTDCSPLDSSVHVIFQARILEWLPFPTPIFLKTLHLSCFFFFLNSCTCPFCTVLKSNKFLHIKIISFIFPVLHHAFGLMCIRGTQGIMNTYQKSPETVSFS